MNDWLDIKGKTVLVTGASSGIGKAIVEELLELGVNVANFDLSDNDLRHPNLLFVKVDVTSRSEVEAGVAKIVERFGNIDAVVNNAGINVTRLLIDAENPKGPYELDDETFEKITMINQKGLYLVSQAVGRILVKNGKGVIVNMASEAGLEGSEGQSAYAATKAAVYSYTRSWAKELGKHGVRCLLYTSLRSKKSLRLYDKFINDENLTGLVRFLFYLYSSLIVMIAYR